MIEGIVSTSYSSRDKFYIDPRKLLPLALYLPQPKGQAQTSRGGDNGGSRGFRGGGGFRGRGGRGGPPRVGGLKGRGRSQVFVTSWFSSFC